MRLVLLISAGIIFLITVALYFIDPVFTRTIEYQDYSVSYEWRLFNNSFCNAKTAGHCFTNETNRTNAEIELCQKMIDTYRGQGDIKLKLEEIVNTTDRFNMTYGDLTNSSEVQIDSIIKYKDAIFRRVMLK